MQIGIWLQIPVTQSPYISWASAVRFCSQGLSFSSRQEQPILRDTKGPDSMEGMAVTQNILNAQQL